MIKKSPPSPSPLESFERSITSAERAIPVARWGSARIAEYIQAMSASIEGMFDGLEDAAAKGLVSFCMRMDEAGSNVFECQADLRGSRFMVDREIFDTKIILGRGPDSEDGEPIPGSMPPGDKPPSDEPKIGRVWDDQDGVLALYDKIRAAFGDPDGAASARDASFLLLHLEHLSERNVHGARIELGGMRDANADPSTGLSAVIETSLRQVEVRAHPGSSMRM
jgi:hypothetical protein